MIPEILLIWLTKYGSFALFALLAAGIVGLPIPDETLMTFAGVLVAQNHLEMIPVVIAAYAGSFLGITLSYVIGRTAGAYLIKHHGHRVGLTQDKFDRVHQWFEKIGKWTLSIGYFIPGVRHLTGYVAGAIELSFMQFAIFAYTGAFLWTSLFLTLGYFSSRHWDRALKFVLDNIENVALVSGISVVLGILISFYIKRKKRETTT
jgi:membrane protein DedA with SNARE-associated domain